jgi:hypothetical protein
VGAPLHVFRQNGTSQILVQEGSPAVQTRNMFQLANNGEIGFNMTNTNLGQTWRFRAAADGFRVSLDGTGGPEMTVFATGAVAMGPGGAQNLSLDASGNLAIQGTLTELSDVRAKEAFTEVDGKHILARLEDLPITQWRYKKDARKSPHLGPTAQDFYAAFGLGADAKHIAPKDLASVALVGVKALQKMVEARDAEIAKRDARVTVLEARLAELEAALARMLAAAGSGRVVAVHTGQRP